jgi:iron complex outermembrane recepter protein
MFGGTTSLRQTWNWSDFRFRRDTLWQGNRLPVVPEHQYRAELTWRHASGVFLSPSVEWRISDVWVDYANTLKAPGYEVLGLTAGASWATASRYSPKRAIWGTGAIRPSFLP